MSAGIADAAMDEDDEGVCVCVCLCVCLCALYQCTLIK